MGRRSVAPPCSCSGRAMLRTRDRGGGGGLLGHCRRGRGGSVLHFRSEVRRTLDEAEIWELLLLVLLLLKLLLERVGPGRLAHELLAAAGL